MSGPAVPFEALCAGYRMTVLNAFDLLMASMSLAEHPSVALAVSELGQEELGKSLSVLAAASLPNDVADWKWLWSSWRNHTVKAHRAFLYELVSPVRLETRDTDGTRLAGASLRATLPTEKEVGFYVAYDSEAQSFVSPSDAIRPIESYHRTLTLLYLAYTAKAVLTTLESRTDRLWYRLFSGLAFRLCHEELYQQEMPSVFAEFSSRSANHAELMADLAKSLAATRGELEELVEGGKRRANGAVLGDA